MKLAIIISACGIIGAIIGSRFATDTNVDNLKNFFGFFLAVVAIKEIYEITKEYIKGEKET